MNVLRSGRKTVSDILTPARLSDTPLVVVRVDVLALAANVGTVRIGGPNVNSIVGRECGVPLAVNDVFTVDNIDLHECWVAVDTADDGFTWTAILNA
ncbi:MAG TPA: hypothetical protein VM223_27015 [Planctomycetota bacterium]|nr:hypothetical protein [Planctomycetota bacterium]